MSIARILVPVTGSPTDAIALSTAFAAAKPFSAHVAALFVHPDPREVISYVYSGVPVSPELIQGIIDGQRKLASEAQGTAQSILVAVAKDNAAKPVPAPLKIDAVTCSLQVRYGFIPHLIAEASRFSDLVVFKPFETDDRPEFTTAIVETLTRVKRPVLLATPKSREKFASRVVIGWDGHDAAIHAVTASLPYLERAASVEILTVESSAHATIAGASALKEYLALHGVEAAQRSVSRNGRSIGESLTEEAAQSGADLLVLGGFGHSHMRETLLGGVTLEILSRHALPVFLMH
jgi:nucleotide-binding universal stress UspA family protein